MRCIIIPFQRMKVLHVSTDFPSKLDGKLYNYGGLGMCVFQLVEGLTQRGILVDILTRKEDVKSIDIIPDVMRTFYIRLTKSRNWKLTHAFTLIPKLLFEAFNNNYDILHAHNPPAAIGSFLVAKLFGIKTVLTMHGPWAAVRDKFKWLAIIIENISLDMADIVTFDSRALMGMYPKGGNYIAIQNAVDADVFKPISKAECRTRFGFDKDRVIYLYSGRAVHGKKLELILDVAKKFGGADFILTGFEIDFDDAVYDNIFYRKAIPNDEMVYLYNACDGLILASDVEGMSRAVLEAMSCGIGVILSDIPANKEVLAGSRAGVLFKTEQDLLERLKDMNRGYLAAMGKIGREVVLRNFSVKRRIDAFMGVYKDLIKPKDIYA